MAAARLVGHGVRVTMLDSGARAPKGVIVRAAWKHCVPSTGALAISNTIADRPVEGAMSNGSRAEPTAVCPTTGRPRYPGSRLRTSPREVGSTSGTCGPCRTRSSPTTTGSPRRRWSSPRVRDRQRPVQRGDISDVCPVRLAGTRGTWRGDTASSRIDSDGEGDPVDVRVTWDRVQQLSLHRAEFGDIRRLNLVRSAHATHMNWNSETGVVDSVDYVDRRTGEVCTVRARAFVVAAGAIDSTVLLLRSVSPDFPTGLGNTAGVIGRYLHDHPREWWSARPERPMTALAHPLYLSRAPFGESAPLMGNSLTLGLARPADRVRTWVGANASSFGVQAFGTMVPLPEVGVRLSDQPNPRDAECRPIISLSFDQATIDNLVASRDRLTALFADAGMEVSIPGPFHPQLPGSSVHLGGTVRMHESPAFGALDRWNRLDDVANVIVCDSSCFTTGPEESSVDRDGDSGVSVRSSGPWTVVARCGCRPICASALHDSTP